MSNKYQFTVIVLFFVLCLLISSSIAEEFSSIDSIIAHIRAKEYIETGLKDYTCTERTVTIEKNDRGKQIKKIETESKVYFKSPNSRYVEVLSVKENGELITIEKKKSKKKTGVEKEVKISSNIFSNSSEDYSFKLLGSDKIRGIDTYIIEIIPNKSAENMFKGRGWISKEDFSAVKFEFEPSKNPEYVTLMKIILDFGLYEGKYWLPLSVKMNIRAKKFFLSVNMEIESNYSDYVINKGVDESKFK